MKTIFSIGRKQHQEFQATTPFSKAKKSFANASVNDINAK
ncbi:hypothetical protein HMPREF9145_2323 [Segatella salivae F0493]|uniref:Uncharacterized protein n=1 Tax=Segatella salivae F0493 TaxID=1395125 RepID=U2L729_9BACT|nr:hypothetical protein HMPREF9145_2323 [Segatella salivae F0493]